MKKLLVIVGDYDPTPSPNTNCINAILEQFNNWEITIVSTCYTKELEGIEVSDNKRIIRIFDKQSAWLASEAMFLPKKLDKSMKRVLDYLYSKIEFPDKKRYLRKRTKWVFENLKGDTFDVIISNSLPFSCNLIAEKYKESHPKVTWFVYLLDPFYNNKNIQKHNTIYRKKALQLEKRIYSKCDYIISMSEIKIWEEYSDKVLRAGIPLLRNNCEKQEPRESKKYGVFSGGLLKDIREPEPVLRIFKKYLDDCNTTDCQLRLFTKREGYYENILRKYEKETKYRIKCEGFIPREELRVVLENASFLVNIGNKVFEQTPSKIFEYMSYGKPIIHFYWDEKDTSIPYLNCYPNILMIDVNASLEKNVSKISCFLQKRMQPVVFEDLLKSEKLLCCVPQYTAELIKERSG